jgi:hypothetical protein
MAVEYIGGSILYAVIEVLGEKLTTPEILGFFKSHKLNDGLLGKLKETLNTLNGLLDDAEEKQITKPAVQRWLNDARHAVYEAEDLMEEIEYEHLRSKDIKAASRRVRNRVSICFCLSRIMLVSISLIFTSTIRNCKISENFISFLEIFHANNTPHSMMLIYLMQLIL